MTAEIYRTDGSPSVSQQALSRTRRAAGVLSSCLTTKDATPSIAPVPAGACGVHIVELRNSPATRTLRRSCTVVHCCTVVRCVAVNLLSGVSADLLSAELRRAALDNQLRVLPHELFG